MGAVGAMSPDVILLHQPAMAPVVRIAAPHSAVVVVEHQSMALKSAREHQASALAAWLSDAVVCLTETYAAAWRARRAHRPVAHKLVVISNGIDVRRFEGRDERRNGAGAITFGMHGRFVPSKDHVTLLHAFARAKQAMAQPIRMKLAGSGPTHDGIQRLVDELNLRNDVEFLGSIAAEAVPEFLRSLDVYVQASLGETQSNALMEAMASGLPVIASDVFGVREMVPRGALLVPATDVAALARALGRGATDLRWRRTAGSEAAAAAASRFSQAVMFERYAALFDRVRRPSSRHLPWRVHAGARMARASSTTSRGGDA
jgi:glycosyltransferase involved in cell wall biosynthesis